MEKRTYEEILKELQEYKGLEETGELYRLPCARGTKVYLPYPEEKVIEECIFTSGYRDCTEEWYILESCKHKEVFHIQATEVRLCLTKDAAKLI